MIRNFGLIGTATVAGTGAPTAIGAIWFLFGRDHKTPLLRATIHKIYKNPAQLIELADHVGMQINVNTV
ncbi:MAG: hypothetical protein GY841_02355 [FCB group bacterium]|nr:hypothetical protein [FCB group bacterium]